jgi:uncharacterized protein (UPF0264 family)
VIDISTIPAQRTSRLLVSVSSYAEAMLVQESAVDILDIKNPEAGALGALPLEEIRLIVKANHARKETSATIGDVPMHPAEVSHRVMETLATGVGIVKIGLYPDPQLEACVERMSEFTARGAKLVAVMFADHGVNLRLLPKLKAAGFYGVMLDTAQKDGRHLLDHLMLDEIDGFVRHARSLNLCTGLAGSLRAEHLSSIVPIGADYIGFRGGICEDFQRRNRISPSKIRDLNTMLHKRNRLCVE